MLQELSIKNFAIIDQIRVTFNTGLTVLTGETGAGKSIIIDALQLLVGGRGSAEFVRHGEKKAEIEGLFYVNDRHPCARRTSEFGIEIEEGMVVLRREISNNGKSVCRINGKLVTIAILREIGGTLIDIHGQHEHQELLDETTHLSLLDQFGGDEIKEALSNYHEIYTVYTETLNQLNHLKLNDQEMIQRLDLLQFQAEEILKANLRPDEDIELEMEKNRLSNYEKIYESLKLSYEGMQGEQRGLDFVGHAMGHIETAAELDHQYKEMHDTITSAYYALEDLASTIRSQLENLEFDPNRLNEIEQRLGEINQLKRKYGGSILEILEYGAQVEEEMEEVLDADVRIEQLEKKVQSLSKDLLLEGKQLTKLRKKWANVLTTAIHSELKALYMDKTVFEPVLHTNEQSVRAEGLDEVVFYLSPNPGEPPKPLSRIASGGELSRIMLALKTIFSRHQGITSIIFDEVDTGVSGRVAQAIAEKIKLISTHSQVLCISHLPQVAAIADFHYLISKKLETGRTTSQLLLLDADEKINEIARMMSGAEITDLTRKHAQELLEMANSIN